MRHFSAWWLGGLTVAAILWLVPAGIAAATEDLKAAWDEIAFMNYQGVAGDFERARKLANPGSPEWVEATLGYALCLQHRQPDVKSDKDRAAQVYDELIDAADGQPIQALALLLRARIEDQVDYYGDTPNYEAARQYYQRILEEWPNSELAHRAALHRAQLGVFQMTGDAARRGINELKGWLASHPDNPIAPLQWMLVGHAYMQPLDEPGEAVKAFIQADKCGLPEHTRRDSLYWLIANLSLKAEDEDTASAYLERIVTEEARSSFAYEAHEMLRDLGRVPPPLIDPFDEGQSEQSSPVEEIR